MSPGFKASQGTSVTFAVLLAGADVVVDGGGDGGLRRLRYGGRAQATQAAMTRMASAADRVRMRLRLAVIATSTPVQGHRTGGKYSGRR